MRLLYACSRLSASLLLVSTSLSVDSLAGEAGASFAQPLAGKIIGGAAGEIAKAVITRNSLADATWKGALGGALQGTFDGVLNDNFEGKYQVTPEKWAEAFLGRLAGVNVEMSGLWTNGYRQWVLPGSLKLTGYEPENSAEDALGDAVGNIPGGIDRLQRNLVHSVAGNDRDIE